MTTETYSKSLEEIQKELDSVPPLVGDDQVRIDALRKKVALSLSRKTFSQTEHHSLNESFEDAIASFEVKHPELTQMLTSLRDMLISVGI